MEDDEASCTSSHTNYKCINVTYVCRQTYGTGREERQAFQLRHQLIRAGLSSQELWLWPNLNSSQPDTRKKKKSYVSWQFLFVLRVILWSFCLVGISLCILLLAVWQYHNTALSVSGWAVPNFTKVFSEYCGCGPSGRQFIHPDHVSDSLRPCKRQFQLLNVWPVWATAWDGSVFTTAALQLCSVGAEFASNITFDLCHYMEVKYSNVVVFLPSPVSIFSCSAVVRSARSCFCVASRPWNSQTNTNPAEPQ